MDSSGLSGFTFPGSRSNDIYFNTFLLLFLFLLKAEGGLSISVKVCLIEKSNNKMYLIKQYYKTKNDKPESKKNGTEAHKEWFYSARALIPFWIGLLDQEIEY